MHVLLPIPVVYPNWANRIQRNNKQRLGPISSIFGAWPSLQRGSQEVLSFLLDHVFGCGMRDVDLSAFAMCEKNTTST